MTDLDSIPIFLEFMKLPDGTPVASVDVLDCLIDRGFFTAPASTKYHGAYEGGLFDHSLAVAKALVEQTERNMLKWKDPRSPYIVGMLRDLCKIDCYIKHEDGTYEHTTDTSLVGHGDKSVMLLSTLMQLTEEEMLCIRYHMGAFTDKEEWKYYSGAVEKYPNVLWTHTADMIASKVYGI